MQLLFGAAIVLFGLLVAWKGELSVGPENSSDEDRKNLSPSGARFFGLAIAFSGVVYVFAKTTGLILVIATILLAALLG